MNATRQGTAMGVFNDLAHATEAIEALRQQGFPDDSIGFIAQDPAKADPPTVPESQTGTAACAGATVGGVLGTVAGLAASAVLLPVAGPALAGGLLLGAVSGAAAGGASGGIVGALLGLSVPAEQAHHGDREFHSGSSVVTVKAGDRYAEAEAILREVADRPEHVHRRRLSEAADTGEGGGSVFTTPP